MGVNLEPQSSPLVTWAVQYVLCFSVFTPGPDYWWWMTREAPTAGHLLDQNPQCLILLSLSLFLVLPIIPVINSLKLLVKKENSFIFIVCVTCFLEPTSQWKHTRSTWTSTGKRVPFPNTNGNPWFHIYGLSWSRNPKLIWTFTIEQKKEAILSVFLWNVKPGIIRFEWDDLNKKGSSPFFLFLFNSDETNDQMDCRMWCFL